MTSRYLLLEIGWLLTNLACLESTAVSLVPHNDMYEENPQGSILYLTSQVLSHDPSDLQMVDQYVYFLGNLAVEGKFMRRKIIEFIDPFELVNHIMALDEGRRFPQLAMSFKLNFLALLHSFSNNRSLSAKQVETGSDLITELIDLVNEVDSK